MSDPGFPCHWADCGSQSIQHNRDRESNRSEVGNEILDSSLLQQIGAWPLSATNRTAKFGDEKARRERFRKCPSCCCPPLPSQGGVLLLDCVDLARDFDTNPLATEGCLHIRFRRLAIAIESNQRD